MSDRAGPSKKKNSIQFHQVFFPPEIELLKVLLSDLLFCRWKCGVTFWTALKNFNFPMKCKLRKHLHYWWINLKYVGKRALEITSFPNHLFLLSNEQLLCNCLSVAFNNMLSLGLLSPPNNHNHQLKINPVRHLVTHIPWLMHSASLVGTEPSLMLPSR